MPRKRKEETIENPPVGNGLPEPEMLSSFLKEGWLKCFNCGKEDFASIFVSFKGDHNERAFCSIECYNQDKS